LKTYTHNKPRKKMLASTMQISNNKPTTNPGTANPNPTQGIEAVRTPAGRERQQTNPTQGKPVPSDTQQRTHDPPTPPPPVPAEPEGQPY